MIYIESFSIMNPNLGLGLIIYGSPPFLLIVKTPSSTPSHSPHCTNLALRVEGSVFKAQDSRSRIQDFGVTAPIFPCAHCKLKRLCPSSPRS
jgi:hypothetical protein